MPISADHDFQKKRNIANKVAKQFELNVHFPFEALTKNHKDICDIIRNAVFVIADLSFERPSCYYELGLAQGLGKKTILLAKEGTYIHQMHGLVKYYKNIQDYEMIFREIIIKNLF
jgi:nucleoside 2-deoxyribosyltransferase